MSEANVETMERFNDAFRRGDWDALAATLDPHVFVRTDPRWPEVDRRDADAVADAVLHGQIGGWPEPGPRNAEFSARFADYRAELAL